MQIFLHHTAFLRHFGRHAEQWLHSNQPPTCASLTFYRFLYALLKFYFFFFFNIYRNIHFDAGA